MAGFTSTEGYTGKKRIFFYGINDFLYIAVIPATKIMGVLIMTFRATMRTSLTENGKSKSRTVYN